MTISNHLFWPNQRIDSCVFTYRRADGQWLLCDLPQSEHVHVLAEGEWEPGPFCSSACTTNTHVDTRLPEDRMHP